MHSNHRQDANSALPDIARDGWITLEERAAWSAPGIKKVVDQITIQP